MRTASSWCKRALASRRSWIEPLLPSVTSFSATERTALALARVVWIRLCLIRLHTIFASIALRCSNWRPSLAVLLRCRISLKPPPYVGGYMFRFPLRRAKWRRLLDDGFLFFRCVEQLRLDVHAEAQAQRGELVLDFVQRLLAEIAVLQHFGLGLHGQLTDGGNVRVVEAVRGADAQLNFVHAHVQQFLELGALVVLLVGCFFELDGVLVVTDEHVEMMLQNGRGLSQSVIRRDAAVRPNFDQQTIVIRALADAGALHTVTHARDGREERVDG